VNGEKAGLEECLLRGNELFGDGIRQPIIIIGFYHKYVRMKARMIGCMTLQQLEAGIRICAFYSNQFSDNMATIHRLGHARHNTDTPSCLQQIHSKTDDYQERAEQTPVHFINVISMNPIDCAELYLDKVFNTWGLPQIIASGCERSGCDPLMSYG
jgi:hypothetical protein